MVYLFVVACTVADCANCPTNKDVCTECGDGKGVDSNGATCTGKLLVLLKCNLFHLIRSIIIGLVIIFIGVIVIIIIIIISSSSSSSSSNRSNCSCSSSSSDNISNRSRSSGSGNHCAMKTQGFQ